MSRFHYIIIPILLIFSVIGKAQSDSTQSLDSIKGKGIVILPVFYVTPETGIAAGVGGLKNFYIGKNVDKSTQYSSWYKGKAIYTQNNQYVVDFSTNFYTKGNKFQIDEVIEFKRFPLSFFGVGNDIDPNVSGKYDAKVFTFNSKVVHQIQPKWFVGLQFQIKEFYDIVPDSLGLMNPSIPGYEGGTTSGFGGILRYDSRDHAHCTYKGVFANMEWVTFNRLLQSDFEFLHHRLDLRKFWQLKNGSVIAWQYYHHLNWGDVPFYKLEMLGGDHRMRGYFPGMYRDKNGYNTQIEYRHWIHRLLSIVVFTGFGGVNSQVANLYESKKLTFGAGGRLFVPSTDRLSIRVDYAKTLETGVDGFYVTVSEAF